MGRRLAYSDQFAQWRERFQRRLREEHGAEFAAMAMVELEEMVSRRGTDPLTCKAAEILIPARVLAKAGGLRG